MELVGKGGKTICFRHMEGHESTTKREDGAIEEMKAGGAEILVDDRYTGDSTAEAQTTVPYMIDVIREADGVCFEPNGFRRAPPRAPQDKSGRQGKAHCVRRFAAARRRARSATARSTPSSCKIP